MSLIMAENEGENKFNTQFLGILNSASVSFKLSDIIKAAVINIEKSIYEEINKKFGELSTTINMLRDEVKMKDLAIAKLSESNFKLSAQNDSLKVRLNDMDMMERRENLTISGLKLNYAETASATDSMESSRRIVGEVVNLCNNVLDVPITDSDISAAFPIAKGSAIAPAVFVVKFVRRFQRDMVYRARKKLFTSCAEVTSRIFINEDLPPDARKLLGAH